MKRYFVFGICIFSLLFSFSVLASSLESVKVCSNVKLVGNYPPENIPPDAVIECVGETDRFTTESDAVFVLAHLINIKKDEAGTIEIRAPDDSLLASETKTASGDLSSFYAYAMLQVKGKGRPTGQYTAKAVQNGQTLSSKTFTISQPDCASSGFFCCSSDRVCVNKADPKYICTSGSCCMDASSCVPVVSGELTKTIVTDCAASGLQGCDSVIGNVYNYEPHGGLKTPGSIDLFFRDIDVDCYNKTDVAIGVYDETNSVPNSHWKVYNSTVTKLAGNYYSVSASIDYIGHIAIIKSPRCVPSGCFIPGFATLPFSGLVKVGSPVKLSVCQLARECDASADGNCNRKCTQGVDPDCSNTTCTSSENDCCNPEKDEICDLDCALSVDPDCADETYMDGLCYPGPAQKRGFTSCDVHCTGSDPSCSSPSQYCNPSGDGVCDPKCPKLSNGVGYLDSDCCAVKGISVTSSIGDCCNPVKDGMCDRDCIPGVDSDCNSKCGNGVVDPDEECDSANLNGKSCADVGYASGVLACTDCKFNSAKCLYSGVPATCNNGVIDPGEECDGSSLNGKTCWDIGGSNPSGILKCDTHNCKFDTSNCNLYVDMGGAP